MNPTIIVPVYNAAADLAACLDSLLRTLHGDDRVLIADDASPDPRVAPVIKRFVRQADFTVKVQWRVENLGFVGNVNSALREAAPNDVLILNTDTVTTAGWLQRIAACAASDPSIGTITPWSNNAEICSFPHFCRPSDIPDDLETLAAAANAMCAQYPELPTGVGFCMYIRRTLLDRLGDFDGATFGRGYGEENDLCRRAAAHGWRNVLCDDVFIGHRGGASFGPTGHQPGGENLLRLCARYPDYNARVADFILRDPLAPLRECLMQAYRIERQRSATATPIQQALFE